MTAPDDVERRGGVPAEVRAAADGVTVLGYAAVFGERADIAGLFVETIAPGAFVRAIARDDVPLLIELSGLPLARSTAGRGTLRLAEDARGLHIEAALDPLDPDVQRIVPKMRRGDLNKMSFGFRARRSVWDDRQVPPVRTIHEVELLDVSIVTMPAYDGTDIGLRSLAAHRAVAGPDSIAAHRARMRMRLRLAAACSR